MRFYFIRHGQSENNFLWDDTGSSKGRSEDPDLTENGHRQARLLAQFISREDSSYIPNEKNSEFRREVFQFSHLYTSLMLRSVRTGIYLSEVLNLPLFGWPELHECGGIYLDDEETATQVGLPGKTRSFFNSNFPNLSLPDSVTEAGWWNRPFEEEQDRALRAQLVLKTLLEKHGNTDDHVAVVSHGAFYNELVKIIVGVSVPDNWFLMHNTAISRFDFWGENGVTVVYHNRTDHLPNDLIT